FLEHHPPPPKKLAHSPSSHAERSLKFRRQHSTDHTPRRDKNERGRALIECVIVERVEDVVDEQLPLIVLEEIALDEGIEAPIVGKHGILIGGKQRTAVDL